LVIIPNSYAALDDILSLTHPDPAPRNRVQIAGTDPVLASNFLSGLLALPLLPLLA
jgi:hypothetical protein